MIGHLKGEVLFCDGTEVLIQTNSGIGYQVYFASILPEAAEASIYISHVIREASEELYGFKTLREKKLFELLISVKGVGPKSGYSLLTALGFDQVVMAIQLDNKKALSKAPGIGPKAAAQILLDLSKRIEKMKMYSQNYKTSSILPNGQTLELDLDPSEVAVEAKYDLTMVNEALLACKELGFKESEVEPLAKKILQNHQISKPEQLVHLVLKEM